MGAQDQSGCSSHHSHRRPWPAAMHLHFPKPPCQCDAINHVEETPVSLLPGHPRANSKYHREVNSPRIFHVVPELTLPSLPQPLVEPPPEKIDLGSQPY